MTGSRVVQTIVGRACGLAVGLGVGAAVVVGLAGQASASPVDAPNGAAAAPPGEARRDATRPGEARRSDAPVAPAASAVPVAKPVGEARSASRRTGPAGLFPSDPRGRLITIYKGTHFAIPNSFGFFITQVSGTGTFTARSSYDLKDEDQYDWNKFTGIAFTPLEPDRNSVMVGWRYNLRSQEFEIAPFYNVDKQRILPNEQTEVISVPTDQTFQYRVDYTGVTITYGDRTVFKPFPPGLIPNVWTAARVSGWFGGNEVAPKTVAYYLKID
ncbi:MAG: hypothetical protein EBU23_07660 [Mycobacteriaceae bacterium]|nr:hypothetical protein [Mycobacterium sp.]NBQ42401.1 hypothetical protein [Mycobacteriaceae bacterium]